MLLGHIRDLSDAAIDTFLAHAVDLTVVGTPLTQMVIVHIGPGVAAVRDEATAFSHRGARKRHSPQRRSTSTICVLSTKPAPSPLTAANPPAATAASHKPPDPRAAIGTASPPRRVIGRCPSRQLGLGTRTQDAARRARAFTEIAADCCPPRAKYTSYYARMADRARALFPAKYSEL